MLFVVNSHEHARSDGHGTTTGSNVGTAIHHSTGLPDSAKFVREKEGKNKSLFNYSVGR